MLERLFVLAMHLFLPNCKQNLMKNAFISLILLYFPLSSIAAPVPDFRAHYSLHSYGIELGKATRELKTTQPNQFIFSSESNTTGVAALIRDDQIKEKSLWTYQDGNIVPQSYAYHHTGSKKQRHVTIEFDWQKGLAANTYKGETWEIKLKSGVLDKLVYQMALMRDLKAGHKGDIEYQVADGGKLKTYRLIFAGEEMIETKLGKLKTYKFTRQSAHKKSRFSSLWCAEAYQWLPVRIEHQEPKGDKVTMVIESLEGLGQ